MKILAIHHKSENWTWSFGFVDPVDTFDSWAIINWPSFESLDLLDFKLCTFALSQTPTVHTSHSVLWLNCLCSQFVPFYLYLCILSPKSESEHVSITYSHSQISNWTVRVKLKMIKFKIRGKHFMTEQSWSKQAKTEKLSWARLLLWSQSFTQSSRDCRPNQDLLDLFKTGTGFQQLCSEDFWRNLSWNFPLGVERVE